MLDIPDYLFCKHLLRKSLDYTKGLLYGLVYYGRGPKTDVMILSRLLNEVMKPNLVIHNAKDLIQVIYNDKY